MLRGTTVTSIPDVSEFMRANAPTPGKDRLESLTEMCRKALGLQLEIADLEERLKAKKSELADIVGGGQKRGELVDMFESLQTSSVGLDGQGNSPGWDVKLTPFYSASVPKDPAKAEAAINHVVNKWELPDMVKNSFTIDLGMGDNAMAVELEDTLADMGVDYSRKISIHPSTLTAEIRRRFEDGDPPSPAELDIVGGYAGKIVKITQRKAK
jgi:hypothetical protein